MGCAASRADSSVIGSGQAMASRGSCGFRPASALGAVGGGVAIQQFDIVGQRLKTVGKAFRDQQRPAVVRRQAFRVPVQKGRRVGAQIHRHIPHLAADAAHQLHLGMRRMLEVHAAHRAARRRVGVVDLGDGLGPAGSGQFFSAEQARQKTAASPRRWRSTSFRPAKRQVGDGKSAHAQRLVSGNLRLAQAAAHRRPACCARYHAMVRFTASAK